MTAKQSPAQSLPKNERQMSTTQAQRAEFAKRLRALANEVENGQEFLGSRLRLLSDEAHLIDFQDRSPHIPAHLIPEGAAAMMTAYEAITALTHADQVEEAFHQWTWEEPERYGSEDLEAGEITRLGFYCYLCNYWCRWCTPEEFGLSECGLLCHECTERVREQVIQTSLAVITERGFLCEGCEEWREFYDPADVVVGERGLLCHDCA